MHLDHVGGDSGGTRELLPHRSKLISPLILLPGPLAPLLGGRALSSQRRPHAHCGSLGVMVRFSATSSLMVAPQRHTNECSLILKSLAG